MQVTYELTQRDFFECFLAHRNRSTVSKWSVRLLMCILILVGASGLFLLVVERNMRTLSSVAPLFGLAFLWAIILWGLPWWTARNQFVKQPAAQGPRTMILDTLGVHWRWNGGSSDIEWKTFIRWLESKNQFLLYSSPACFNMVPKRALTAEQNSEFRTLLAANIGAKPVVE